MSKDCDILRQFAAGKLSLLAVNLQMRRCNNQLPLGQVRHLQCCRQ